MEIKTRSRRLWKELLEGFRDKMRHDRAQIFISLIVALATVGMVVSLALTMNKMLPYREQQPRVYQQRFFDMLDAYFASDPATEDVGAGLAVLFNSLDREYNGKPSVYGYACLLEDYIAECLVKGAGDSTTRILDLQKLLARERIEDTRRLLVNLDSSVRNGDTVTALENISEMADQIRTTNSTISGLRSHNSLMMVLTIVGVILTILFGIGTVVGFLRRPTSYPQPSDDEAHSKTA